MDAKAEQYVASAKAGLTNVHRSLKSNPTHWRNCTAAVKQSVSYIDHSRIMHDPRRIEERVWILNEVQRFAYFDPDSGGVPGLTAWCEREWNRVLATDSSNLAALTGMSHSRARPPPTLAPGLIPPYFGTGLGNAWLCKAQYLLARIHREESKDVDDATAERRLHTADYVEVRALLQVSIPSSRAFEKSLSGLT